MDTLTFRPTIDWSHELLNSIRWVLEMFGITAPCVLVVLVVVGRMTEWGRQFWRVTGDYFKGRQSLPVWVMVAAVAAVDDRLGPHQRATSYYINDLFSSLQVSFTDVEAGMHGFWAMMVVFAVLATCYVVRLLLDLYLMQRFIMRWRIWLSHRFVDDWLGDFAYFRRQFSRQPIDNPDQRIQQDIDVFTTGVGGQPNNPAFGSAHTLLFGAVEAVLSVFSFSAILWRLSGPLTIGGITLPRALFWIVIVYVLAATIIAFVIGRPLIRLSYLNELRNAGFRYALVRVRDASAAIGLYRGENAERKLSQGPARRSHGQLPQLAESHGAVHGLEPVHEPSDQPAALHRSGAAPFRAADLIWRRHAVGHRVRHRSTNRCRSSGTHTTSSRVIGRPSSAWTGCCRRTRAPARSLRWRPPSRRTARWKSTVSRFAPPTVNA